MAEPSASPRTNIAAREQPRGGGPAQWVDDLSPISASDWSFDRAAHLLERAGFGMKCGLEIEFHIYRIEDASPQLDPDQAAYRDVLVVTFLKSEV